MATLLVTNLNDNGLGSLRAAIAQANSGDMIQFDSSLASQVTPTIKLTSGQININKNLTIDGLINGTTNQKITNPHVEIILKRS